MKKLLTILLLITLAGQASGYLDAKFPTISHLLDGDEKKDKGSEEKNKEYLSHTSVTDLGTDLRITFCINTCDRSLSPVLEHITPPPDVTL